MKSNKFNTALGIIALLLSIHFYIQSKVVTSLTLIPDPEVTSLISREDNQSSARLSVFYDSVLIRNNLNSKYLYFYNNGGEKISVDQVREKIRIQSLKDCKLHEVRIVKVSHPNIGVETEIDSKNGFGIEFKELYPNDGVKLQLIYEGEKDQDFYASGNIAGMTRIQSMPVQPYTYYLIVSITFLFIMIFMWFYLKLKEKNVRSIDEARAEQFKKMYGDITSKVPEDNLEKYSRFEKIMTVVAPLIGIVFIIGLFFIAYYGVQMFIELNPNWFIPNSLKI